MEVPVQLIELRERFKLLPTWGRWVLVVGIAMLPAAYNLYEQGDSLELELEGLRQDEASERQKFENARQKKANLPKLEEQLAFTQSQLEKARKSLPDQFLMDDVLEKVATIAKEVGVTLLRFDPQDEKLTGSGFRYIELPIKVDMQGKFGQILKFVDRLTHLEMLINIGQMELLRDLTRITQFQEKNPSVPLSSDQSRRLIEIKTSAVLSIYRSASDEDVSQLTQGQPGQPQPAQAAAQKPGQSGEQQPGAAPPPNQGATSVSE